MGERESRPGLLLAFAAAELALTLNQAVALLWFHPRPFAVPIGHTLLQPVTDSSFPSDYMTFDYMTFLLAVGIGLLAWT